jgi:ComF family protein
MRTAIHRLKFEGRRELATPLGNLLASFVCRTPALGRPERVVPVPLHPARQRARGYNHALLLAQPVARALGVPLLPHGLARVVDTVPQTALHRADRWANVTDAFRAGSEPAALCGRSILLVDDVLTSGATAAACARTLRAADAGAVYVVTVARAQPPGLTL